MPDEPRLRPDQPARLRPDQPARLTPDQPARLRPDQPARLWGAQYPFERNQLQRSMTLTALGGIFAVTLVLLIHADVSGVLGIAFLCAGAMSALAAVSRRRYVQETRAGFAIVATRGGGFVFGSALAFTLVGGFVAALVLHG